MNTGQTQWTDEELGHARALRAEGYSASAIARIMGGNITRNAVIGRLHRADAADGLVAPHIRTKVKREKIYREPPPKGVDPNSVPAAFVPDEPVPIGRVGEMTERGCKFIHGDPLTPDFQYCGHPAQRSYCTFHQKLIFVPVPKKRRVTRGTTSANW